ncbi:hypothetical protein BX600DRAFT_431933 [Xylariales sp. PMI_506]|nr:hypothetical protein BX600DRAFT_431933 [Xylariales sp. PMI_506]
MSSMAAAILPSIDVLSTPELLELILLALDTGTLLVSASRVSRFWHNLINNAPALQEALYFRPRHAASVWDDFEENPLIFDRLPLTWIGRSARPWSSFRQLRHDIKPNAYLRMVCGERSVWVQDRFARPEASWRKMLAVQPVSCSLASGQGKGKRQFWAGGPMNLGSFLAVHGELTLEKLQSVARLGLVDGGELYGVRLMLLESKIIIWGDTKDFRHRCRGGFVTFPSSAAQGTVS